MSAGPDLIRTSARIAHYGRRFQSSAVVCSCYQLPVPVLKLSAQVLRICVEYWKSGWRRASPHRPYTTPYRLGYCVLGACRLTYRQARLDSQTID